MRPSRPTVPLETVGTDGMKKQPDRTTSLHEKKTICMAAAPTLASKHRRWQGGSSFTILCLFTDLESFMSLGTGSTRLRHRRLVNLAFPDQVLERSLHTGLGNARTAANVSLRLGCLFLLEMVQNARTILTVLILLVDDLTEFHFLVFLAWGANRDLPVSAGEIMTNLSLVDVDRPGP